MKNKNIIIAMSFLIASIVIVVWLILWILKSPSPPRPTPINKDQYNIIVLLDLSDRINRTRYPVQAQNDKAIINFIVSIFDQQVKKKFFLNSRDKIQIIVAPQPSSYDHWIIKKNFTIDMTKLKIRQRRTDLDSLENTLNENISELYRMASETNEYLGADIWGFFNNNLENYIIPSSTDSVVRNILIILTDGYLQFERDVSRIRNGNRTNYMMVNWFLENPTEFANFDSKDYGLLPIGNDIFQNLEVLVLEVNPRDIYNSFELAIIQKYWCKWLDEMNIKKKRLKTHDSPMKVKEIIEKFIFSDEKWDCPKFVSPSPQRPSPPLRQAPPPPISFRSVPNESFSETQARDMIRKHNFYCKPWNNLIRWQNPNGRGIKHNYEIMIKNQVVLDKSTNLLWEINGSDDDMDFREADNYIRELNRKKFAGCSDWRLPTLEEAMSLMESSKNISQYISPVFNTVQFSIWTADKLRNDTAWFVRFDQGRCAYINVKSNCFVRAVRTMKVK